MEEIKLKVSNTAYPDGTMVRYLFGMKKPEIMYSLGDLNLQDAMKKKLNRLRK